jgi:hypothetical protein
VSLATKDASRISKAIPLGTQAVHAFRPEQTKREDLALI